MIGPWQEGPPPATIRAVRAGDVQGLLSLFGGLSKQDSYRRWFSTAVDIRRAARWAAHPERSNALGLVAVANGQLVGHAALIRIDSELAEVCFEVAAPWRHHGLAGRLLAQLGRCASAIGVRTLTADVLLENVDMLSVLRAYGPRAERCEGGIVTIDLRTPASGGGIDVVGDVGRCES